jgi:hypothetical protein
MVDALDRISSSVSEQTSIIEDLSDLLKGVDVKSTKKKDGAGTDVFSKVAGNIKEASKVGSAAGDAIKSMAESIPQLTASILKFAIVPKGVKDNFIFFLKDFYSAMTTTPAGKNVKPDEVKDSYKSFGEGFELIAGSISKMGLGLFLFNILVGEKTQSNFISFIEKLSERMAKVDVDAVKKGGEGLSEMGTGIMTLGLALALSAPLYAIGAIGAIVIVPVVWALSQVFAYIGKKGKEIHSGGEAMIYAGGAIASLALGLVAFRLVGVRPLDVLMSMGAVLGIGTAFALIGKIDSNMIDGAKALLFAGGAIASIALGVKIFEILDIKMADVGLTMLTVGGIGLAFGLIGGLHKEIEKGAMAMMLSGLSIISITIGVLAFKAAGIGWEDVAITLATVGGLAAIVGIVGTMAPNILIGAAGLAVAGIALMLISIGLETFKGTKMSWEDFGLLSGVVAGLTVVFATAGGLGPLVMWGAVAMITSSIALLAMAAGIAVFKTVDMTLADIGLMSGVVAGLTGVFALAGAASILIIPGSVALILASVAILTLTGAIAVWRSADIQDKDTETLSNTIGGIVDSFMINPIQFLGMMMGVPVIIGASIAMMTTSVALKMFKKLDFKEENIDNLKNTIKGVAESFADMGSPIMMLKTFAGISAVSGAGRAIRDIAEGLIKFDKMKIDPVSLGEKVKLVVGTISEAFATIGSGKRVETSGILGAFGFEETAVEAGISSVKGMGDTLSDIARGVKAFAEMTFGDVKIGPAEMKLVGENISTVLTAVAKAFEVIGGSEVESGGIKGLFGFKENNVAKGVEAVKGMGAELVGLAESVKLFATMTFKDPVTGEMIQITPEELLKVGTNLSDVLTVVAMAFSKIGSGDVEGLDPDDIEDGVQAVKGLGSELSTIANSIKTLGTGIQDINPEELTSTISAIFNVLTSAEFEQENVERFGKVVDYFEKLADTADPISRLAGSFEKMTKSLGAFSTVFKSMDADVLKNSTMFMGSMVTFSKVDPKAFDVNSRVGKEFMSYIYENTGKSPSLDTSPVPTPSYSTNPQPQAAPDKPGEKSTQVKSANNSNQNQELQKAVDLLRSEMSGLKGVMNDIKMTLNGTLKVREEK